MIHALENIMATKLTGSQDVDILKDEKRGKLREVGNQAVWSLSSCKAGKTLETAFIRLEISRAHRIIHSIFEKQHDSQVN